jgi:hypothetical protein
MQTLNPYGAVRLDTKVQIPVFTENRKVVLLWRARFSRGRRLVGELSGPVPPNVCVQIDCKDSLVLGVVLACWREGTIVFAAIEVHQVLNRLAELMSMREDLLPQHRPTRAGTKMTSRASRQFPYADLRTEYTLCHRSFRLSTLPPATHRVTGEQRSL